MPHVIAVLEDDRGRTAAMKAALDAALPATEVAWFDEAPRMIEWLSKNLSRICLLCLDHDLGPVRVNRVGERLDPRIGRDVVDFLVTRAPSCPVIIHSSNSRAVDGMMSALEGAGWSAERITPYDDLAWVGDWSARVKSQVDRVMGPGMQVSDGEYRKLEILLSQERWKDADRKTLSILCALTGREMHLVPEAVPLIRCEDLDRICALWDRHSAGRYGFQVQARIWAEVGGMARLVTFDGMSQEEKEALGLIESRFVKRIATGWASGQSDPTQPGHFPVSTHQCSYGCGLIGMLVAAFSWRLTDCGISESAQ